MSLIQKPTTVKHKKAEFSDDQLRAKINQQTQHCKVPVWLCSSGYANCLDQTNSADPSLDTLYWLGSGIGEIITLTFYRNTKEGQEREKEKEAKDRVLHYGLWKYCKTPWIQDCIVMIWKAFLTD